MEASEFKGEVEGEIREQKDGESGTKAYRVMHDVTFPRVISKISGEGEDAQYATEGTNYPAGSYIMADTLTPRDRERMESGELDHLVQKVEDDDEAEAARQHYAQGGEPEFGIFIAEHEAEAHALEQYGHHVVPKEQEMEVLSSSADHARAYQEQVKSMGLDRRPNLEASSPENRERVPDEFLAGGEQRTGAPHHRGAAAESQEGDENPEDGGEGAQAARPAPGVGREDADSQADESGDTSSEGSEG